MSRFNYKPLKCGDILRKYDQYKDLVVDDEWDDVSKNKVDYIKIGHKIDNSDLSPDFYAFRRPDKETLKLIKHIQKELVEIRERADAVEKEMYN